MNATAPHPGSLVDFLLSSIENDENIARAAGHGDPGPASMRRRAGDERSAGWLDVSLPEGNVRQSYDLRHIRTFSPSRMVRECQFKSAMVRLEAERSGGDSELLRRMAYEYRDRAGYEADRWAPSGRAEHTHWVNDDGSRWPPLLRGGSS